MATRQRRVGHTEPTASDDMLQRLRDFAQPLEHARDLDPLMERIGDARYVLLGEASHGTHEYYAWRAAITRRLIVEKGFSFIAVEGDWPDCYQINRYIKNYPDAGESAADVLSNFRRWPTWMWANREIQELAEALRVHNAAAPNDRQVGFYGLDVYSLWDSLYQVMGYVNKHDPKVAEATRKAFQCFEPYGEDVQGYARATRWIGENCEGEVVKMLSELRRSVRRHPDDGREAQFNAEQNALVVKNAEHYYRTMVRGGPDSWNVRDRHMFETLERLMEHHGADAKAIVWEHNTHVGDARYTDMAGDRMVNIGQLARESRGEEDVVLVGFGSYEGSVIAGKEWEAPMQRMDVPRARPDSWEDVFHDLGIGDGLFILDQMRIHDDLMEERGHRAIGVVYQPAYEQYGNYVPTVLPRRYDAFLYFDRTEALQPLPVGTETEREVPETFPTGM